MATMKTGLIVSVILHVMVFSIGYWAWPTFRKDRDVPPPELLEVEVFEIKKETRVPEKLVKVEPEVKKPDPEPEKKPAEVKKTVKAEAPPPPKEAVPLPEKKPAVKKEVKPIAKPRSKPKPPRRVSKQQFASLIDRLNKEAEDAQKAEEQKQKLAEAVVRAQRSSRDVEKLSLSYAAAIRNQVGKCWGVDLGQFGIENMSVIMAVEFNRDGQITKLPKPSLSDRLRMSTDDNFTAFVEEVERAIIECAPYVMPREDYDLWRSIEFNFDPVEN
ncbi:MAG: hypothetical protein PVF65_03875 [Sphingomonadales bacterium]|jgi:hypothetical protein